MELPVHFEVLAADVRAVTNIHNLSNPPSSPALNPIEGWWRIEEQQLHMKNQCPTSLD